jgi:L-seryl-tRNA(Ser) seleniumtransferase
MNASADATPDRRVTLLRQVPSVDELLAVPAMAELAARLNRALVVEAARTVLQRLRDNITHQRATAVENLAVLAGAVTAEVSRLLAPSLRTVINATGVILHTNLGRAPLAEQAMECLRNTASTYTNLEYDVAEGARGKRDVHTAPLLARLTGAEAAIVVNNNAAAVFLVLAALARGGEVIVSRGELIEIGESFRIPDIMAESGAALHEVGTTNRTSLSDYERALNERTRLLLRVHRSNFRIIGFTEQPSLGEMVELGRRAGVPVYEDLGSGCLVDLAPWGLSEPVVRASIEAGASVVSFSGDKLLGGPQSGIIAGKSELLARMRKHPLFRALRVDKLVIAALEATLSAYLRGDFESLPVLRMIRWSVAELDKRASQLVAELRPALLAAGACMEIADGESVIGGGATPAEHLPTRLLRVTSERYSAAQLEARLRAQANGPPVLARVAHDLLLLDLRTVFPAQDPALVAALAAALR